MVQGGYTQQGAPLLYPAIPSRVHLAVLYIQQGAPAVLYIQQGAPSYPRWYIAGCTLLPTVVYSLVHLPHPEVYSLVHLTHPEVY